LLNLCQYQASQEDSLISNQKSFRKTNLKQEQQLIKNQSKITSQRETLIPLMKIPKVKLIVPKKNKTQEASLKRRMELI
jgi:sortase (surface protein transpeptidase)